MVYNLWEDKKAEESAQSLLADVQSIMDEKETEADDTEILPDNTEKVSAEMATVKVGGYDCIGILSVPVLDLKLPVLTDWSYAKLKKAPCHYHGTYYDKDFVIAAHNYKSHFGRLSELQPGDIVFFTDVNGVAYYYEVILLETLPKEATKEMITGGFDLSLYTCTPGGASRVTVRCNAAEDCN
jgi:sortase A